MNVTDVQVHTTWGEPRNWVFVKIVTDRGLHGWGEATLEGKEETVAACVGELGQLLIGQDPLAVEHHWQRIFRHGFWRGGVVLNSALAGIDDLQASLRVFRSAVPG